MAQLASGGTQASASDGGFERTAYLLARSLGYDDSLHDRAKIEVGIAVLFKKGNPVSERSATNIGMALDNLAGTTVQGLALRSRLIPFEGVAELKLAIDKKDVEVFYVCEGLDPYLDAILKLSRDLKVLSVAGNEAMVHHGVALGIVLSAGSRGTIVVNLRIARSEGANFGSDLLRVARVIR
jgi:hypothetical protein